MSTSFEPTNEVKSLVEALVKAIVSEPDEVNVVHSVVGNIAAFGVRVAKEDVRKVIGARGKHVKAIQVITKVLCESVNKTADLTVIEDSAPPPPRQTAQARVFPLAQGRDFAPVKGLLLRTAVAIANNPKDVEVIETPMGMRHIFEIRATEAAHRRLHGQTVTFDYGEDGLVLGSIKNLFDAIGKNHGKLVMIVLTKKT